MLDDINVKGAGPASDSLNKGQNTNVGRFLNKLLLPRFYWDFKIHLRQASNLSWDLQNAKIKMAEWGLEKKKLDAASRSHMRPKI